ncbi:sulfotransferase family protein [Sinorhizobium sp. GL28]|uniref:sulfotransferase family protein n=1 Tax=Sinorhizobium sp. GL28 TaxID=1358418 RepID=UPI00072AD85D|nr:sulfotransferase family protein [Sinorhizobium sp. GL28]KSV95367.1 hypothetical protein N184_00025 [Sinorhizobium sp. GL28]
MKVFGIGLNKTGTSTLAACLHHLGYHHLSCRRDLLEAFRKGCLDEVMAEIDQYQSFEDWPYPLMYRNLEERYGPEAKFILTIRKTPEIWLRSLEQHSMFSPPREHCRKLAYGYNYPHYSRRHHLAFYERHNREVQQYFAAKGAADRLLVFCWEDGDGWEKLCSFLGKDVPDGPIPTQNVSAQRAPSGNEKTNNMLMRLYGVASFIPGTRKFI